MYEIFEQLLQENNVTPYKVSKTTGIATATLSDWKNGKSTPKQDKLQLIADYFGVTVDYLMGRNSEENSLNMNDDDFKRIQLIKINPDIKALIDESADLSKKDIDFIIEMVRKIKN